MIRLPLAAIAALFGLMVILPIFLLGLPFWIVAAVTRSLSRRFEPRVTPWKQVIEFDPVIGWKPQPSLDVYCSFQAGHFHVRTDDQGWRGKTSLQQSDVVVFGDSYAFAYGIDDESAFFSCSNGNLRIKAVGSPGYNMVQELLWMRRLSPELGGKLVVWFIYYGNDLYDNLLPNFGTYRMPFVRELNGTWEIVDSHINSRYWPCSADNKFRLRQKWATTFVNGSLSQRAYRAAAYLLAQGKALCVSANFKLAVVSIPWPSQLSQTDWLRTMTRFGDPKTFDPFLPDQKITEICYELRLPFIAGKNILSPEDHIPGDGHWNSNGHRRIAAAIQGIYTEHAVNKNGQCEESVAAELESNTPLSHSRIERKAESRIC
jgi:hypothetical protein